MPLNPATLTAEILKITDANDPAFGGFPTNTSETGQRWGNALKEFFDEMVVPILIPGTTQAAADAFASSLAVALGAPGAGIAALPLAYQAAGAVLAAGALPANPALPPVGAPIIPPLPPTNDPHAPAAAIASAVFAWAKTGLYTIPPAPPAIPWT